MNARIFGKTGRLVSEMGLGTWQLGAGWGDVTDEAALATLRAAWESGTNFFDTADVYGDGRSERIIAAVLKERGGARPFVATKAGRRLNPHVAQGYTAANLNAFVDRSLQNLETDCLDLVQLHCPPTEVFYMPETFGALDDLVRQGKLRHYGVSVERVEEGLKVLEYPNLATVQIVFNAFRQRPAERFLAEALRRDVGVIARVPPVAETEPMP